MKNLDDLAIKLAQLYGIEVAEKPNQHLVKTQLEDIPLFESNLFYEAFGFSKPNEFNNFESQSIGKKSITFEVKVTPNTYQQIEKLFSNSQLEEIEVESNTQFAMAA